MAASTARGVTARRPTGRGVREVRAPAPAMDSQVLAPRVRELLARSDAELVAAQLATDPGERFLHGHLAALRAGAALVEALGRTRRRPAPRTVWDMVSLAAPGLAPRAAWFASAASLRAAVESGRDDVDDAAADQHVAAAEDFADAVRAELGDPVVLTAVVAPRAS